MNIAFFLTPKKDVIFETTDSTMRQVIERMEYHHYTAIPILDEMGKYIGTITEGDLLRKIKNTLGLNIKACSRIPITDVPMRTRIHPVYIQCNIEDLAQTVTNQNFVPVLDDDDQFIGIIKRSDILHYLFEKVLPQEKENEKKQSLSANKKQDL
ncbi:MAG TPA: CBS domain-containing protein [Ruminococcaceae bacterium]|nr:CBS domain-containing protein [Oscillospiraceae bacterium]